MTLGPDILLGADGDLDLTGGDIHFVADVAQAIRIRLLFVAKEWFLDVTKGLPYFEQIWVKAPNLDHVGTLFRDTIVNTSGVGNLTSFSLDFDVLTRTLSVSFTCDTDAGEISDFVEVT